MNNENTEKNSKTFHDSNGRFTNKKKAKSLSYGHYGKPNGGKFQYKNGPRIPKHKGGSEATGPTGGIGKHPYKLKDKTKAWENTDLLEMDGERLGNELEAIGTEKQRLKAELAKLDRRETEIMARISILKETSQLSFETPKDEDIEKEKTALSSAEGWHKALQIAGLSMEQINKFEEEYGAYNDCE